MKTGDRIKVVKAFCDNEKHLIGAAGIITTAIDRLIVVDVTFDHELTETLKASVKYSDKNNTFMMYRQQLEVLEVE